jgi:hypothetical protein
VNSDQVRTASSSARSEKDSEEEKGVHRLLRFETKMPDSDDEEGIMEKFETWREAGSMQAGVGLRQPCACSREQMMNMSDEEIAWRTAFGFIGTQPKRQQWATAAAYVIRLVVIKYCTVPTVASVTAPKLFNEVTGHNKLAAGRMKFQKISKSAKKQI